MSSSPPLYFKRKPLGKHMGSILPRFLNRCLVCSAVSNLRLCGGCRASTCNKIKQTQEKLEEEEARLRPLFLPEDVFENCVALEHFSDMLRLGREDKIRMSNYVPALLLRPGQEQEGYGFLNRWATKAVSDYGRRNFGATSLSHAEIRDANAFEPVDKFRNRALTLSHLASLTLLKLRVYLDLHDMEQKLGFMSRCGHGYRNYDCPLYRPLGQVAKAWVRSTNQPNISEMARQIKARYFTLRRMVHDANEHFWGALINTETPALPAHCSHGSREETNMAVFHCKPSWEESEVALAMIKGNASQWFGVYEGPRGGVTSTGGNYARRTFEATRPTPGTVPRDLYDLHPPADWEAARFLRRNHPSSILLYTDGACLNNGRYNPRGGWAVVYGPANVMSGRLEEEGPFGDTYLATSNRAGLRAVVAALRLCDWQGDGFDDITIATDSTYIVDGTTSWTQAWFRNGWKTGAGQDVKNKDLWELIQAEVEIWAKRGLTVKFWRIPREWNTGAKCAAKAVANKTASASDWILVLCLEHEDLLDACFGSFVNRITSKAMLTRAATPGAAIRMLSFENRPSTILITDAAITRQRHVFERVADCLFQGTTVLLCGFFNSMVHVDEFRCFFAKLGLPWTRGSYHRTTVSMRRGVIGDPLASRLPTSYSQKAVFVKNIDRSAAWYAEHESSDEAAVAFARVGQGMLGYIGDVNGEEMSTSVVMAMCGLLG
ncbi:hypothetical protein B0T18DRAFT_438143 [Schizothecium vesticola]|uniref:ribonuclease H n=1 Tax=Schizothecium vesticola TaxID=314040 RepID=A0AA40EV14_9PEZI|nr:hypothetical protein B0T18DRAFT_438143 [Schizothecium vesticola]